MVENREATWDNTSGRLPRFHFYIRKCQFAGFYRIDNPFAGSPRLAIIDCSKEWGQILRAIRDNEGEDYVPYPIFPEPHGLLHWASDDNGNCYFWHTKGVPSRWTVVQWDVRGTGFKEHKCSMSKFLDGVLNKKIKALASGFPRKSHFTFEPWDTSKM